MALIKLGAAPARAPGGWRLVTVDVDANEARFTYRLNRKKLRQVRRREGRYLLRTNLTEADPAKLWDQYLLLVKVEESFRTLELPQQPPPRISAAQAAEIILL